MQNYYDGYFVSDDEFEEIVDASLNSIPDVFIKKIENLSIVIENYPSKRHFHKVGKKMLLGLYEGIPKTKRGRYGIGGYLPDKITIFKRPIESISSSKVDLIVNIRNTIIHEIAHHFGMDEKMVRSAEMKRVRAD